MTVYRLKCSSCGEAYNQTATNTCPRCNTPTTPDLPGLLRIYRKGNPIGAAAGYGIYLNGQPFGHIANTGDVSIPLPYGRYSLKMTCGMTRRCVPFEFELSPSNPQVFVKGHIRPGFWTNSIVIEQSSFGEMPQN